MIPRLLVACTKASGIYCAFAKLRRSKSLKLQRQRATELLLCSKTTKEKHGGVVHFWEYTRPNVSFGQVVEVGFGSKKLFPV
jgi:hypothetical protein